MKNNRKAVELTLNAIAVLIIMIVVLVLVIFFFSSSYFDNSNTLTNISSSAIDSVS